MTIVLESVLSKEEILLLLLQPIRTGDASTNSTSTANHHTYNSSSSDILTYSNEIKNDYWNPLYKAEFIPLILQLCEPYSNCFNVTCSDALSLETHVTQFQLQLFPTSRLYLSIACLLLYIQFNYTGPIVSKEEWHRLPPFFSPIVNNSFLLSLLSLDGELPFQLVHHPILLYTALSLFDSLTTVFPSCYWWKARALQLQADLFEFPGATLHDQWVESMQHISISSSSSSSSLLEFPSLLPLWHLELAVGYQVWKEDHLAMHHLSQAQHHLQFEFQVEGKLGKRTKFQEQSHSQLVVLARSSTSLEHDDTLPIPLHCLLNDDVLLEKIAFDDISVEEKEAISGPLSFLEQCILLCHCQHIQNTHPNQDVIAMEQMQAYVRRILENPCHHPTLYFSTLHFRSQLETHRSRTQERAVLQLQALTDYIHQSTMFPFPFYLFATPSFPTVWQLQLQLAECYMKLGAIKSALQVYEQYQVYEAMVTCYTLLEKKDKAEQLVLELLTKEPNSPRLLCILGDLRNDPRFYAQAWEVSNHTLARPQRSLGYYYFKTREYQHSLTAWREALKLNPMFTEGWFIAGCAALQLSDWSSAIELFSRSTAMNADHGHAWSNLATSYLQLNHLPEAFHAYKQALRSNQQDWKVWDNFLPVALQLKKWEDALLAFRALLQHAPPTTYVLPMSLLHQFIHQLPYDQLTFHQKERVQWLFQTIQSKAQSWTVYHSLALAYEKLNQPEHLISCCEQGFRWLGQPLDLNVAHSACLFLWYSYQTYGPKLNDQGEPICSDWAYQAKLAVSSLIAKLKEDHEHTPKFQDLCKLLNDIETTITMQPEE